MLSFTSPEKEIVFFIFMKSLLWNFFKNGPLSKTNKRILLFFTTNKRK